MEVINWVADAGLNILGVMVFLGVSLTIVVMFVDFGKRIIKR